MNILFWGLTVGMAGKVLLAVGVLMAHTTLAHEHRVDGKVLQVFKLEHIITLIGISLIIIGYLMEVYFYGFTPFHDCDLETCGAVINVAISQ